MSVSLAPVCLDASFLVQLVTHGRFVARAANLWQEWHHQGRELVAPGLIYYEISNALYRYRKADMISAQDAERVLESVLAFSVTIYQDHDLHRRALDLAEEFSLPATYDAHYLALAERLDADFWTADRRLFDAVHETLSWVHLLEG